MTHVPATDLVVYLGVGSNIDPERHLLMAYEELDARFGPVSVSSVYRSTAVGFDGDDFLNMAIFFATRESPREILQGLAAIHERAGRPTEARRVAPRTLDVDLLLYGDIVVDEPGLKLPRDDVKRYGFVLAPLAEVAPDLAHPVSGESMQSLWSGLDDREKPFEKFSFSRLAE